MDYAVQFNGVSKRFRRGEIHDSLRDLVSEGCRRLLHRRRVGDTATFWALRDVSFAVQPGRALGIIGPNGAGKSTALKLLAGILRCDEGSVQLDGRLAALIEIGAGMHGDLTGMENIYLSGAIMGMNRREIRSKLDAIIAFSGLERFIHTPVKRYSTGMQARLGFSAAVHISPEILLVDEVLSVGDVAFRHRCEERMTELVRRGTALVFVTHNLDQMRGICDEALVLDAGKRTFIGEPSDAVGHYLNAVMHRTGEMSYTDQPRDDKQVATDITLRFVDDQGVDVICAYPDSRMKIEIAFDLTEPIERLTVETALRRGAHQLVVSLNSRQQGVTFRAPRGRHQVTISLDRLPLAGGNYFAFVRIWDADRSRLLGETPFMFTLQVDDRGQGTGLVALEHEWSQLEAVVASAEPVDAAAVGA